MSHTSHAVTLFAVPKLWSETIEQHRLEVRETVLDTAAALVVEHGLRSVTMSQIAADSGIARATLYKYFPDVESILLAWHDRQITQHLEHLATVRDRSTEPDERLRAVLDAYALIVGQSRGHHSDLAAFLHNDRSVAQARGQLHGVIRDLLSEAAEEGVVRQDVDPDELAAYCVNGLAAARDIDTKTGVQRLVTVVLDGLRPSP